MLKLVIQPSFRAVGQTQAEWQTFEKPENTNGVVSLFGFFQCRLPFRVCLAYSSKTWLHY